MMRFFAPAKLNLFLHITGKRADGYHDLQTIFQFLDYADELDFELRDDSNIILQCNISDLKNETNLVVRAARILQSFSPKPDAVKGVDIYLHKKIPIGAGLGGGSSDAAVTLKVLNNLWQCHLSDMQLLDIGRSLGADIPVFLYGRTAWGEGRGDELNAIFLPETWYIVLIPAVKVSTAEMFSAFELTQCRCTIKINDYRTELGDNVFEPLARRKYPEIDQAMKWLDQYATAKLSGTGAGIFADFPDQISAQTVFDKKPDDISGFVARSLREIPFIDIDSGA